MTSTAARPTMDEFLAMPEEKPYREFLRGEVMEKTTPNLDHGTLVAELIAGLYNYLRESGEGHVSTEVRHADRDQDWVFLPDLHVTLRGRLRPGDRGGPVETMPDFAIEVLTPDDRPGQILRRVGLYSIWGPVSASCGWSTRR